VRHNSAAGRSCPDRAAPGCGGFRFGPAGIVDETGLTGGYDFKIEGT